MRFGKLRVAVGAHADFGRMQVARNLDFIDMEGDVAIDMDGRAFGVDASAFYEVRRDLSIGATFRSGGAMALAGGANFTAPDAFSDKIADQAATSRLELPAQLVVGARYQRGSIAVLADLEWTRWSTSDALVIDFAEMQTPHVTQTQQWNNTLALRTGAEYTRQRLTVRGGGYLDQSPAPASTLAPSTPDSSRVGLVAGASFRLSTQLRVDGFFEQMFLLRRDTQSTDALQASYGGRATIAGLGLAWTP